mgnify:CR=1 FL=1
MTDTLSQSLEDLLATVASHSRTATHAKFLNAAQSALAETVASDLSATRKVVAVQTISRMVSLYAEQFEEGELSD